MISPALIMGGIQGAKSLLNYALNKRKPFRDTAYGKYLDRVTKTGIYNPTVKRNILQNVGKTAGNIAENTKAGYRGRLASMGMLNSIAGASKLADINQNARNQIVDTGAKIDIQNALSKVNAEKEQAMAKDTYNEQLRQERQKLLSNLIDTGAGAYSAYRQQKDFANIDFNDQRSIQDWISKQPNTGKAIQNLYYLALAKKASGENIGPIFTEDQLFEWRKNYTGTKEQFRAIVRPLYENNLVK